MSSDKKTARNDFAERALELAVLARQTPPPLFLVGEDGQRETKEYCPLSAEAGRMAVFSMTICNPQTLLAASKIEGYV